MISKATSVGCIGVGFVGSAVVKGFNLFTQVKFYDQDPSRGMDNLADVLQCDFVFVCLPTPMECACGGKCDLSIMESFFASLKSNLPGKDTILIIKSTVPVGTTKQFIERYPYLHIAHSPEFLTARSAALDFICTTRNVVGCEDDWVGERVKELYEYRFPGVPCHVMKTQESELVKYMTNAFLSTKVMFFNEMRLLSDKLGLSWENLLAGVMSDGRIAMTHHQCPGWDGWRGIGNACLPKDLNSLINTFREQELDPKILKAAWEQNLAVREFYDWTQIPSACSNKDKKEGNSQ